MHKIIITLIASTFLAACSGSRLNSRISEKEISPGWESLIGAQPTDHWHNYLSDGVAGWSVVDGVLSSKGNGGDLVTNGLFSDFELRLEWRIEKGGNSGVFFHVLEDSQYQWMYQTGPEYQIIDNGDYPEPLQPNQVTGSASDVLAPAFDNTRPVGSWNETAIVVKRGKVNHWLNGKMILAYELDSEEWNTAVAQSKFRDLDYAAARNGRIGLQDHGQPIWFRNIRIRKL